MNAVVLGYEKRLIYVGRGRQPITEMENPRNILHDQMYVLPTAMLMHFACSIMFVHSDQTIGMMTAFAFPHCERD